MATAEELAQQLSEQRRTVDFDTFDIQVQELLRMLKDGEISVAPVYQRQFRWDSERCSELIESLLLGIPIPNLFMATNIDSTWEVVDGVQRLSSLVKFAGDAKLRAKLGLGEPLKLENLKKIAKFNDATFDELPANIQLHFRTRPLKVVTLNDKSDKIVRIDLFERLNTGGIELTNQEIRDCVFYGPFATLLDTLAKNKNFNTVVKLTKKQEGDGTREECVLRYFAFLDRYKKFDHSVKDFLDNYMRDASKSFATAPHETEFEKVFAELAKAFPKGLFRAGGKGRTPLNLYEGIAVGAALALRETNHLKLQGLGDWIDCDELRSYTTGATNDRGAVRGRIEFCRDRFLGQAYVPSNQS
ncbi:DUF262 domain-containing protein [Bradyrhizobium sp. Pa8]|uniref:DUF262 domain-containing protein n=1 Tax=Bradyrhizobium sp. Pa8 TaxID=3386552 RepID=UPI00403FBA19